MRKLQLVPSNGTMFLCISTGAIVPARGNATGTPSGCHLEQCRLLSYFLGPDGNALRTDRARPDREMERQVDSRGGGGGPGIYRPGGGRVHRMDIYMLASPTSDVTGLGQ